MSAKQTVSLNRRFFCLNASTVARIHTVLAYAAFGVALLLGLLLHYKRIVKNDVAGYPQEWFPSVSATIGDWYPERNLFQILIALTSGPRFGLVLLQYYLHYSTRPTLATVVFVSGIVRTLSCGGWVYITSSDDHDVHDVCMILYMVCNLPWMIGGVACTSDRDVRKKRGTVATAFFTSIIPLIYFFIQHKVHRIPGAYTRYSFFEWGLIFFDVLYDGLSEEEFRKADIQITLGPVSAANGSVSLQTTPIIDDSAASADKSQAEAPQKTEAVAERATAPKNVISVEEFRPQLGFLSDVYLSYIFWSTFTALIPTLFYFSVWELGIAGHELALLATLSPILFKIRPFFHWMKTKSGQAFGHSVGLVAVGAVLLESPTARVATVAPAVGISVLRATAEWSRNEAEIGYHSIVSALGFMITALSKHWNYSNNPVWPFVEAKSINMAIIGLFVGVFAVYEQYRRPTIPSLIPKRQHTSGRAAVNQSSRLCTALSLGSLVFTLHNLLADPTTLVTWSWTGYTNGEPNGPVPHVHAALTLIAQSIGLLVAIVQMSTPSGFHLLTHPLWFVFGAGTAYVMYACKNWMGYGGGLGLAVFLMSILPAVLNRAAISAQRSPAATWGGGMAVYCVLVVGSVFTVAYAFVPGGQMFRERTGSVLVVQMACLALAFDSSHLRSFSPSSQAGSRLSSSAASYSKAILAVLSVLSVLGTLYKWPSSPPLPFKPGPRVFNAGIWTLHFGIDNTGRDSQRGVAKLINDMELDVVGFLETDLHRTTFGHRDLTRFAVEELGYYVDIGPGPNAHTWGAALLSKFPIINSTHHLLPSPHGELAPAIEAVLDIYGTEITVVVSHNGQEEDPLDRELQSKELGRIMAASYPRPVVFLGYVVTKPHAERPSPYKYLVEDGRVYDIDEEDRDRWCEYILYRGLYRTAYARVSRGIITDTELQIGQFVLPRHGIAVTNETRDARYLRSFKEKLPEHHWFPMKYYGDENQGGVDGHFYHVFGTPLYYNLPENAVL